MYLKISARTPTQKESNKIPKIQPVAVQLEIFTCIYTVYIQYFSVNLPATVSAPSCLPCWVCDNKVRLQVKS